MCANSKPHKNSPRWPANTTPKIMQNQPYPPHQQPNPTNTHHKTTNQKIKVTHTLGASSSFADTWVLQSREDCIPEAILSPRLMEFGRLRVNEDPKLGCCCLRVWFGRGARDWQLLKIGLQMFCFRWCRSEVPLVEAMAAINASMVDNKLIDYATPTPNKHCKHNPMALFFSFYLLLLAAFLNPSSTNLVKSGGFEGLNYTTATKQYPTPPKTNDFGKAPTRGYP